MELRHLRYFTAVVQWKGYREASRHLYVAQPSISEAVSDLERELGIKLFSREGRVARLTPEGQVFYEEAIKTLAQAERSIATAQRAGKGEIGRLGIGCPGYFHFERRAGWSWAISSGLCVFTRLCSLSGKPRCQRAASAQRTISGILYSNQRRPVRSESTSSRGVRRRLYERTFTLVGNLLSGGRISSGCA